MNYSIVIPLYNKESFVCETLQSLVDQTKPPLELIIVDDQSTDNGLEVARAFLDSVPKAFSQVKIDIVELPVNQGVSYARNIGFSRSTGDVVIFLDADDVYEPTLIEVADRLFKEENADFIVLGLRFFPNGEEYPIMEKIDYGLSKLKENTYLINQPLEIITSDGFIMGVGSNVITKRTYLEKEKYDEKARFYQGIDFWYRVLKHVLKKPDSQVLLLTGNYLKVRIVQGSNSRKTYQRWDEIGFPPVLARFSGSKDVHDKRLVDVVTARWVPHSLSRLTSLKQSLLFILHYRRFYFQYLKYKFSPVKKN